MVHMNQSLEAELGFLILTLTVSACRMINCPVDKDPRGLDMCEEQPGDLRGNIGPTAPTGPDHANRRHNLHENAVRPICIVLSQVGVHPRVHIPVGDDLKVVVVDAA